jgi:hypothetical protein
MARSLGVVSFRRRWHPYRATSWSSRPPSIRDHNLKRRNSWIKFSIASSKGSPVFESRGHVDELLSKLTIIGPKCPGTMSWSRIIWQCRRWSLVRRAVGLLKWNTLGGSHEPTAGLESLSARVLVLLPSFIEVSIIRSMTEGGRLLCTYATHRRSVLGRLMQCTLRLRTSSWGKNRESCLAFA